MQPRPYGSRMTLGFLVVAASLTISGAAAALTIASPPTPGASTVARVVAKHNDVAVPVSCSAAAGSTCALSIQLSATEPVNAKNAAAV